jgi:hypothetical protein
MRKSLWIIALLFAAIGAPNAHADSYDPLFSCTAAINGCTTTGSNGVPLFPSAAPVSFPAPTLIVTMDGASFAFSFQSTARYSDNYTWSMYELFQYVPGTYAVGMTITDSTFPSFSMDLVSVTIPNVLNPDDLFKSGDLTFLPTSTPEPSSIALMLAGIGLVLVIRKRFPLGLPRAI